MAFGLSEQNILLLINIFNKYSSVKEVKVYGSRAKGNFTERSDLDMVVYGKDIDRYQIASILMDINDSDFPQLVDLKEYDKIKNTQLIEHIDRIGQIFYQKEI